MALVGGLKKITTFLCFNWRKSKLLSFCFCDLFECLQKKDRLGKKSIYGFWVKFLSYFIVRVELPNWCGPLRDYKYAEILIPSAFWVFGQKMGQLEPMSHKLQPQAASFTSALQYAKQITSYDMEKVEKYWHSTRTGKILSCTLFQ